MTTNTIIAIISFVLLIAYIAYGQIILPNVSKTMLEKATNVVDTAIDIAKKYSLLFTMASKFVLTAKQKFEDGSGESKREWVISQLKEFCSKIDLDPSDDELTAINESAYVNMKKDEESK